MDSLLRDLISYLFIAVLIFFLIWVVAKSRRKEAKKDDKKASTGRNPFSH